MKRQARSLRRVAMLATAACTILVAALVGLLWMTGSRLDQQTALAQHRADVRLARQLQLKLLSHARHSHLFAATRRAEVGAERDLLAAEMGELLDDAATRSSGHDGAVQAGRAIESYLADKAHAETHGTDADAVVLATRASFERAAAEVEELRRTSRRALDAAMRAETRLRSLMLALGCGTAALLLATLLLFFHWGRRLARASIDTLNDALARVAAGDDAAGSGEPMLEELAPLLASCNAVSLRLAEARRERLAFLGGVAHDLRSPLHGLRMGLDLVRRRVKGVHIEVTVGRLERQVRHLERMVGDLLDAACLEAGTFELHRELVDLREVAREARVHGDGRTLVLSLPDEPVVIEADATRLGQVLANLISNAVKHSPQHEAVEICVARRGRDALIAVNDRGSGIPPQLVGRMFAPFWRHGGGKPGSGLGLSVVARIVEAHGGSIAVSSREGSGTRVEVRLPTGRQQAPSWSLVPV